MNHKQSNTGLEIYWRLLRYLKPHLVLFILSILGFMVFALTNPALAMWLGYLIGVLEGEAVTTTAEVAKNTVETPLDFNVFDYIQQRWLADWFAEGDALRYVLPLFVIVLYLIRGIGLFIGNYTLSVVAESIVHSLRKEMFLSLTKQPTRYFDEGKSGNIISMFTFNVQRVTVIATDCTKVIIREGLTTLFLVGYLLYLNWQLTSIFFILAPFVASIVHVSGKYLRKVSRRLQDAMGAITSICGEMIGGQKIMRLFGGEKYERQRFDRASAYTRRQNIKMVLVANVAISINQFIVALGLGVLVFIALAFYEGQGAKELVTYVGAVALLPKGLKQISEVYSKMQSGIVAADTVFELIDQEKENDSGREVLLHVNGNIEIKNLTFNYAPHDLAAHSPDRPADHPQAKGPALKNINLTINAGETVALVGKSGSGKSTLTHLIPRYYDCDDGCILIDGVDIKTLTLKNLRSHISLVSQEVVLFDGTVAENIAYGELANKSREEIIAAAKKAHAWEFIERLPNGLDTQVGEDANNLSGGQRQRLSIARALLKDAPILIFDEATSALDSESEQKIQQSMNAALKDRTTLVVAHRLSTIENADRIVVMADGEIVEQGCHRELLVRGGHYAKLHSSQIRDPGNTSVA